MEKRRKETKGIFIIMYSKMMETPVGNFLFQLVLNSYRCVSLFDGHQTLVQSLGRLVDVDE